MNKTDNQILRVVLGKPNEYPLCIMDGKALYAGLHFPEKPKRKTLVALRDALQVTLNNLAEQ